MYYCMKTYKIIFSLLLAFSFYMGGAQELELTAKDSIVSSSWVLGIGYNIVDDSATPFGDDFMNIKDTWNALPYPSSISIGRYFKNGLGIRAVGSYNKYKVGKRVDGEINTAERDYFAIDGMVTYDLNKIVGETAWFDPFLQVGAGYSDIGSVGRATANAGFGFNTWFSDKWGLNFNTMGKWGIKEGSTKQLQHSAGVVFRFGVEKELSKKGQEKLALIEENQRISDSIAAAKKAEEEAKLMAERLAQEKEKARLAAEEQARRDAENRRRTELENKIKDLGNVYFRLNSSYLSKPYKELLDNLAVLMKENPGLTIQVGGHTDSRGAEKYNQSLSERRVKQTLEYLIGEKGIDASRLTGEGYGETQLVNECDNTTYCPESKHKLNRRSAFEVVEF